MKSKAESVSVAHPDSRIAIQIAGWQRFLSAFIWLTLATAAVLLAITPLNQSPELLKLLEPFGSHVLPEKAIYSPLVYLLLLTIVFYLEMRYPVRDQAIISTSFLQDVLWYVFRMAFRIALISTYFLFLTSIYERYLSFLTIESVADWHPALRAFVSIVLIDFLRWLGHFIKHKVPAFWLFHTVHHSQRELNLFTDARAHPMDQIISRTIRFIPLLMFQNAFPVIVAWVVIETAYAKLYHANIRLNMGPLRYLLVTPQSHRIHHSSAPQHHDKNFGFMFCVWDRLFGTHYEGNDEYPETGVTDPQFPHERHGAGLVEMLANIGRQLVYPFKVLFYRT